MVHELRQFLEDFGEGTSWGVLDEAGLMELHGQGLEEIEAVSADEVFTPRGEGVAPSNPANVFSDLGQWCLKVLLSHRLPPALQIVARGLRVGRPIRNASELARVAGVSGPVAWRTVSALQQEGLLSHPEPLRPLQTDVLMARWRAASLRGGLDIRTRWLFPSRLGSLERLSSAIRAVDAAREGDPRRALGLFAAAEVLGQGFVEGVAPFLLHEDPQAGELERLGLMVAGVGERVDVFVRRPRFASSVFRGATVVDGVPVADALQIWLDVSHHPARGAEMAEYLARGVLAEIVTSGEVGLLSDEDEP
ncbi:MAG: hypothetical protein IPK80_24585 [Nannocystis sp.]|nr:hypothetical protein [Nannocystis sp.]